MHGRRIGSLSCMSVGSTSALFDVWLGSGLSPQVPGGGRRWLPKPGVLLALHTPLLMTQSEFGSTMPPGPVHWSCPPKLQAVVVVPPAFTPPLLFDWASQLSALQNGLVPKPLFAVCERLGEIPINEANTLAVPAESSRRNACQRTPLWLASTHTDPVPLLGRCV